MVRATQGETQAAKQGAVGGTARLILVCGLPGSGKTTVARRLETELGAIRFSADEWMQALAINLHAADARERIEALQWAVCQKMLERGLCALVEWGTWGRWERDRLRLRARELGAAVELHVLYATEEVLFRRIAARGMEDPPIRRDQVAAWFRCFEAPSAEELLLFDAAVEYGKGAEGA